MTPAEFNRMLREKKIPPLVLLFGEEDFLLERALRQVRETTVPAEARDFNYQTYSGKEIKAEAVLDTARTLPIFSERRLVVVKNVQDIPAAELDSFLPYLKDPVPETVLLFTAEKVDARRKFFQEFKKHGLQVEFRKVYDNQIPAFVREQAREAGRSFTEEALALFCKRVGANLQEVNGELGKLFAYLGKETLVDVGDVAAVVSDTRVDSVFDLTNALGERRTGDAVRLLRRILGENVAPLVILSMITRHLRQLWQAHELLAQKVPHRDLPRKLGINPYFIDGILKQAGRSDPGYYRRAFELLLETDIALKSSGAHPSALLEKLILDIASWTPIPRTGTE